MFITTKAAYHRESISCFSSAFLLLIALAPSGSVPCTQAAAWSKEAAEGWTRKAHVSIHVCVRAHMCSSSCWGGRGAAPELPLLGDGGEDLSLSLLEIYPAGLIDFPETFA